MQEQLITFETAKVAKEKGFQYNTDNNLYYNSNGYLNILQFSEEDVPAPTQSLLQRWLREEYEIYVHVKVWRNMDHCNEYTGIITKPAYIKPLYIKTNKGLDIMESKEVSFKYEYEEALEQGLFEALKLIK